MSTITKNEQTEKEVATLIKEADAIITNTLTKIKYETIIMYFNIGEMISKYKKENNAKHGDDVINTFIDKLSLKYGKGFNKSSVYYAIKFYNLFSNFPTWGNSINKKSQMSELFRNVTWSHIRELLVLEELVIFLFYIKEVSKKELTIKEIRYAMKSRSYERTISNQKKNSHKPIEIKECV